MKKATFTKMTQGTQEDYVPIVEAAMVHSENLPERIIEHLNMLKEWASCSFSMLNPKVNKSKLNQLILRTRLKWHSQEFVFK